MRITRYDCIRIYTPDKHQIILFIKDKSLSEQPSRDFNFDEFQTVSEKETNAGANNSSSYRLMSPLNHVTCNNALQVYVFISITIFLWHQEWGKQQKNKKSLTM